MLKILEQAGGFEPPVWFLFPAWKAGVIDQLYDTCICDGFVKMTIGTLSQGSDSNRRVLSELGYKASAINRYATKTYWKGTGYLYLQRTPLDLVF